MTKTKKVAVGEDKEEKFDMSCMVEGCDYSTGFLTMILADTQVWYHWEYRHGQDEAADQAAKTLEREKIMSEERVRIKEQEFESLKKLEKQKELL